MTFNHTEKTRAKQAVRWAIKRGELMRPNICGKCGEIPKQYKDGRAAIQAHHHDYSKPLDVEWICIKCHRLETPVASGERNAWHRLSDDLVEMILDSQISTSTLARAFGVAFKTVWNVRHGRSWSHAVNGRGILASQASGADHE